MRSTELPLIPRRTGRLSWQKSVLEEKLGGGEAVEVTSIRPFSLLH